MMPLRKCGAPSSCITLARDGAIEMDLEIYWPIPVARLGRYASDLRRRQQLRLPRSPPPRALDALGLSIDGCALGCGLSCAPGLAAVTTASWDASVYFRDAIRQGLLPTGTFTPALGGSYTKSLR